MNDKEQNKSDSNFAYFGFTLIISFTLLILGILYFRDVSAQVPPTSNIIQITEIGNAIGKVYSFDYQFDVLNRIICTVHDDQTAGGISCIKAE